jgi:Mrp family chromosome partitioning ATPase
VHKLLDCKPMYDLSDYLFQHTDLEEILFSPGLEGLVILPGGKPMRDSSEILSSPRMRALAEEIKGRYDSRIVIFDLPPLLVSDDALAFSPHVDSMLLVIEEGRASKQQLRAALDLLGATKLLGVVLNKSQERMPTQS